MVQVKILCYFVFDFFYNVHMMMSLNYIFFMKNNKKY
jgi:hypothetical protein